MKESCQDLDSQDLLFQRNQTLSEEVAPAFFEENYLLAVPEGRKSFLEAAKIVIAVGKAEPAFLVGFALKADSCSSDYSPAQVEAFVSAEPEAETGKAPAERVKDTEYLPAQA